MSSPREPPGPLRERRGITTDTSAETMLDAALAKRTV